MNASALRSLSLPHGMKGAWSHSPATTFITSTQVSPRASDLTARCFRSNNNSPKRSVDDFLESCANLQADLRPTKEQLREALTRRSHSTQQMADLDRFSGKWREKSHYSSKRNTILRTLDRQKLAESEKEIKIVSTFIGRTEKSRRARQLSHKVTCGDLQDKRVRTLLSLNKRDFGGVFDLSHVRVTAPSPTKLQPQPLPEEDDNVMLRREIARIQHSILYDPKKEKPQKLPQFFRIRGPPPEMAVDLDHIGPLSRFIFKEGGKYNAAWLSESRRYRQQKLQNVYERALEQRKLKGRLQGKE